MDCGYVNQSSYIDNCLCYYYFGFKGFIYYCRGRHAGVWRPTKLNVFYFVLEIIFDNEQLNVCGQFSYS